MSKLFFAGVPTGADVRKLKEKFGRPEAGAEIPHEEIEACIGVERKASRYHSVTSAWRRQLLRDHNLDLAAVPGFGFRSLNAEERISAGVKGVRSGTRKTLRSIRRADAAVTDDPLLIKKQDTLRRYGVAVAAEATGLMRQIEPPRAGEQTPRAIPPKT